MGAQVKDPLNSKRGHKLYQILRGMKKDDILKASVKFCKHGHNFLEHPQCFTDLVPKEKIGFLDIESSNLNADFGFIISYAIKDADSGEVIGRVLTPKEILSKAKDKYRIGEAADDIIKFDRIVTYYGARFDVPFLRTRAVKWGSDFPVWKVVSHTDAYFIVRNRFHLSRNRLETACRFFKIAAKTHPMEPDQWQDAMSGDKAALKYIWDHNVEDVHSLHELWNLINEFSQLTKTSM